MKSIDPQKAPKALFVFTSGDGDIEATCKKGSDVSLRYIDCFVF